MIRQDRAPSVHARQGSRGHANRAPSFHAGQGSQVDGESSLGDQPSLGDRARSADQAGFHESRITSHESRFSTRHSVPSRKGLK